MKLFSFLRCICSGKYKEYQQVKELCGYSKICSSGKDFECESECVGYGKYLSDETDRIVGRSW